MPINVDVILGTDAGPARFPTVANSIAKAGNIRKCSHFDLGLPPWNHVSGIQSIALSPILVAICHYIPSTSKTYRTALPPSRSSPRSSISSTTGKTPYHRRAFSSCGPRRRGVCGGGTRRWWCSRAFRSNSECSPSANQVGEPEGRGKDPPERPEPRSFVGWSRRAWVCKGAWWLCSQQSSGFARAAAVPQKASPVDLQVGGTANAGGLGGCRISARTFSEQHDGERVVGSSEPHTAVPGVYPLRMGDGWSSRLSSFWEGGRGKGQGLFGPGPIGSTGNRPRQFHAGLGVEFGKCPAIFSLQRTHIARNLGSPSQQDSGPSLDASSCTGFEKWRTSRRRR